MRDWLKKKLRQFLCEHRNCESVEQIKTVRERFLKNQTQGPEVVDSEILYLKKRLNCEDCGAKNLVIKYKF